ncbi:MAG: S9 family peptidase [Elusimicrobia bacterium]|nr:S9 family peptidase [Elusimicrobiota bacterium]
MIGAIVFLAASIGMAQGVSTRAVGQVLLEDVPPIPADIAERMLQYQNTRGVGMVDLDDRGSGMLITTRFGETTQLHWVAQPLGMRKQLTFFKEPVREAALRPGGRDIVFAMDLGGNEYNQLYLYSTADGRFKLLTDGKSKNGSFQWSRSGKRLAYVSTERNGKDFDIWLADPGAGTRELLQEVEGHWQVFGWSPDDSRLLVQRYVSINESYLHLIDVQKKAMNPVLPLDPRSKASYDSARWSGDGKSVYFTSDERGEFLSLGRLSLDTKKVEWMSSSIPWDVESLDVSRDGSRLAFVANENGSSALYLLDPQGKTRRIHTPIGVIESLDFSEDGRKLGLIISRPTAPSDAYVLDVQSGKLSRWTESETGGLPAEAFVEPSLIEFESFDRRNIPAYYYRPKGAGPFPYVIHIHGGPEAQERPWLNPSMQYWVNELNIAVLLPNVRGSAGYGKSYLLLDNGFKREDSVKDIGALLDWAKARPELDSSRAAVLGGSYGGYMVLASLARFPDRLRAGVDAVGISNFVTFLKNTAEYRRDLRRAEYGDERDPEMLKHLEAISPTNLVDRIRSRLFVIQGANDPRVPASEAEQIVRAVRRSGQPAWYMLAKDEGHGFGKKSNRDLMGQAVVLFWQRHLLAQ